MLNSLIHILRRRPLRLFLEILLIFFFALLPIHHKQDIKTGRSCLRTNIEATQREGFTYTIIRSRNLLGGRLLAVLLLPALSPLFFSFIPKLLFKTSLPAPLFLPCSLPPVLFVSTFSARQLPPFSLPTHSTNPSPFYFPLRYRLCLKIPRAVSKLQWT